MSGILLGLFTVVLILVSAFLVLIILMQRASSNSGMGSALGGGAAESALGGEAGNVLTKLTVKASVVFFVVAFGLYLGHLARYDANESVNLAMPTIKVDPDADAEPVGSGLTAIPDSTAAASEAETDEAIEAPEVEAGSESGNSEVEGVIEQLEENGAAIEEELEAAVESVEAEANDANEQVESAVEEIDLPSATETTENVDEQVEDLIETPIP